MLVEELVKLAACSSASLIILKRDQAIKQFSNRQNSLSILRITSNQNLYYLFRSSQEAYKFAIFSPSFQFSLIVVHLFHTLDHSPELLGRATSLVRQPRKGQRQISLVRKQFLYILNKICFNVDLNFVTTQIFFT